MDGLKGAFDSFRVEEAYNWRDDIMEITRQIVHETDEARLNNIAEHFEVDLSEIRDFLEMKRKKMQKPQTNADLIRSADSELTMADLILKLVKKIPEGENKRRTLYQLLEQEVQDG